MRRVLVLGLESYCSLEQRNNITELGVKKDQPGYCEGKSPWETKETSHLRKGDADGTCMATGNGKKGWILGAF